MVSLKGAGGKWEGREGPEGWKAPGDSRCQERASDALRCSCRLPSFQLRARLPPSAEELFDRFRMLRYRNNMVAATDVELTRALERCEVPKAGFPHASHLRVAWVYLCESASVDEALARMGATLRRFASSVGRAEKYSDAITAFWMYQMAAARAVMPGAAVDDVLRAYPRLLDKDLIASASRAVDPSGNPSDRPVSRGPA